MGFFSELKRRNVVRVSGVYAVVGWLLLQVATVLEDVMGLPGWFDGFVFAVLLIGFPLALIFAWAFELTPEGLKRTARVDPGQSIAPQTAARLDFFLVLGLFAFAAALLLPGIFPGLLSGVDTPPTEAIGGVEARVSADASIAVLPFANMSADADQEFFADGVSEELLNKLARLDGLKVAGRTSSFVYKGRNENLQEIGRVLNVAHILEGSVRTQGQRIRVSAQLIQVSDGFHLWSDTYDRNLEDIFAVQDDIARQITAALRERLLLETVPEIVPSRRADTEAYERFLRARDLIYRRERSAMAQAAALLTEAIAIDPDYAALYAARAKAYTLQQSYNWIDQEQGRNRALADVQTALVLDPELPEARAVRGLLRRQLGDFDLSLSDLRFALDANPSDIDARLWYAQALGRSGRFRERFAQVQRLVEIDPLYPPGLNNGVGAALDVGDLAAAEAILERGRSRMDDSSLLDAEEARIAFARGNWARSLGLFDTARVGDLRSVNAIQLGLTYWALGENPLYQDLPLPGVFRTYMMAWHGERDAAAAWALDVIAGSEDYSLAHPSAMLVLYAAGKHERLTDYFRREYAGDVEVFWSRMRSSEVRILPPYFEMAHALKMAGDTANADQLLQRGRSVLDRYEAGGFRGHELFEFNALYWALREDASRALDVLRSYMAATPVPAWIFAQPGLGFLGRDPRFLALRRSNLERVNEERAKAGLAALSEAYYGAAE